MSRLDQAPEVITLARDLGLSASGNPVEAIVGSCLNRIEHWVREAGSVSTIDDLETLITRRLQMVFEEIWTDGDFGRIKEKYAKSKKDRVFAALRPHFDDAENPSYGILIRRESASADAPDRYVAVIDCRGNKAARRFFTRWHEIAHRLTTVDELLDEPVFRSEKDPIEQLMDEIAGHVGFYDPIFDPAFQAAHQGRELLLFATVEAIIRHGFPDASFQATLCACTRKLVTPVIYLEAALGHKAHVRREIEDDSPRLFDFGEPSPGELRAVRVVANEAALRERFMIPMNMRVPQSSVIYSLFMADASRDNTGREDLGMWSDSKGKRLDCRAVAVEGRKVSDRVIAIVQPVELVRLKPQRSQIVSLFAE